MSALNIEGRTKWASLLEEQKLSGKNQKDFCTERGLSSSSMSYTRSALKTEKATKLTSKNKNLAPVKIIDSDASPFEIKITLPNGFSCSLPSSVSSSYLKQIMGALLSC